MMSLRAPAIAALLLGAAVAGCLGSPSAPEQPATLPKRGIPLLRSIDPASFLQDGPWSHPLVQGPFSILPVQLLKVPSVDGTQIHLGVYLPEVPEGTKVPVILDSSPYFGNGEGPVDRLTGERAAKFLVEEFVPHGYAVVLMSVRGTGDSEGCNDFMGPLETADINVILDWSAAQPWSTGAVAMIGKSYDGGTAWQGAATGNPALKTIVPIEGVASLKRMHFRNGTAEGRAAILGLLYATFNLPASKVPAPEELEGVVRPTEGRSDGSFASGVLCPEVAQLLASQTYSIVTGDPADPLGFWAARDAAPIAFQKFQGSLFMIHGLGEYNVHSDNVFPVWNQFPGPKKLLLGQWNHAYPDRTGDNEQDGTNPHSTRYDFAETLLRWFDRELKGADVDTGPVVEVEDNQGQWRIENTWPPADATSRDLRLSADGTLQEPAGADGTFPLANPAGIASFAGFFAGAAAGAAPPVSHVDFRTGPIERDLRIAGAPQVPVTAIPTGEGGRIGALLLDQGPEGEPVILSYGFIDLRFAEGGDAMKPVVPGQPVVAKLELLPMDVVLKPGHELVLRVTTDVMGELGPFSVLVVDTPTPLNSFPVILQVGGDSSLLKLPVIERTPEQLAGGWPFGPAPE